MGVGLTYTNEKGIKFRNKCEQIFYNSNDFIRIEHPIIKIKSEDTDKWILGMRKLYNKFVL